MYTVFENHKKVSFNSTLRAKRATFTIWVDKSSLKMPKMVNFGDFLRTWSLQSNSVTRQVTFKRTKIGRKCQNWKIKNATFYGIFKHCVSALQNLQFNYAENVLVQILMRNNTQQPSVKIADNCWYWLLMSIAE